MQSHNLEAFTLDEFTSFYSWRAYFNLKTSQRETCFFRKHHRNFSYKYVVNYFERLQYLFNFNFDHFLDINNFILLILYLFYIYQYSYLFLFIFLYNYH